MKRFIEKVKENREKIKYSEKDLAELINEKTEESYKIINILTNGLYFAFLDETGLKPSECVIFYQPDKDGNLTFGVRKDNKVICSKCGYLESDNRRLRKAINDINNN